MAKGIELPINVLVILVIAVLVMISMVLFIFGLPSLDCDTAKSSGCFKMVQDCEADPSSIPVEKFTHDGQVISDLQEVCTKCYGKETADECREFCGCQVTE